MTATEQVILVDEKDNQIGIAEKLSAHQNNQRHRAFSVFILRVKNNQRETLLQQRAATKYHSPNLWTNTCCSHPRPDENILEAGRRRLKEEMYLDVKLESIGSFHYIAHFDNGLVENEIDHVLIGFLDDENFKPNPDEIQAYRWVSIENLKHQIHEAPQSFTPWLPQALVLIDHYFATLSDHANT